MEIIKNEIKREVIDVVTTYKAVDGTEFDNQTECEKYEKTAKCAIMAKFNKLIVSDHNDAWELMAGYDDNEVFAVKMNSDDDVKTVLQFIYLDSPFLMKKENEDRKAIVDKKVFDAYENGDLYLFGRNCEGELYTIGARMKFVNNLLNLGKSKINLEKSSN